MCPSSLSRLLTHPCFSPLVAFKKWTQTRKTTLSMRSLWCCAAWGDSVQSWTRPWKPQGNVNQAAFSKGWDRETSSKETSVGECLLLTKSAYRNGQDCVTCDYCEGMNAGYADISSSSPTKNISLTGSNQYISKHQAPVKNARFETFCLWTVWNEYTLEFRGACKLPF